MLEHVARLLQAASCKRGQAYSACGQSCILAAVLQQYTATGAKAAVPTAVPCLACVQSWGAVITIMALRLAIQILGMRVFDAD